jgi:2',3'-cyclic-nucleotide 2'-phosphodiesterase (5'-nucleotidase family)
VSETSVHYENILILAEAGIIEGYPDGTFRPRASVTRGQMASLLARTLELEPAGPPYAFTDIAGSVHAGNIQALYEAGVIRGFDDGTFRVNRPIARGQMASLIGRLLEVEPIATGPFTDVAPGSEHAGNINALADLDVMVGRTATSFEPRADTRRDQTASVIVRTLIAFDVDLVLTVLHINDGESALVPDEEAGFPGVARFASDLFAMQDSASAPLTVSSGDNYLAGPRLNASLENPDVFYDAIVYTHTGFEALTTGNHEFDFGPDVFADFIEATDPIPHISANLDVSGEPRLAALQADGRLAASTVVSKNGRDIGIVGATYEDLETISSPRNATTGPVRDAVQAEVDALTDDGVDIIILSSHLQNLDTELALVPELSNVDAVVGGGGGEALGDAYPVIATDADGNEVPVVTTPGNYTDIGRLVLRFDEDGDLIDVGSRSALVPVAMDGARDSFLIEEVEEPVSAYVAQLADVEVGVSEVPLDGRRGDSAEAPDGVRTRETNLGSLLADSMLWAARERAADFGVPEADVALQNGGGIRNDAVIPPRALTVLDTFNVAAFVNIVSVAEMDGTTLWEALERSVASQPGPTGAHGQWGGVRFTFDPEAQAQVRDLDAGVITTPGERIVDAVVTRADGTQVTLVENGTVVGGDEMFTMASIDFLLSGQDGYIMFRDLDFTRVGITYQQSLAEYISELGTIDENNYPDLTVDNDAYSRFGPVGQFSLN